MARGRGTRGTLSDPNIGENMARGRGTRGTLFDPNIGENMARGRGTRGRGGHTLPEDTLPTSPLPPATSHIPPVDSHVAPVTSPALAAASPATPVTSPALADVAASPVSPFTQASTNSSNIASSCSSRLPVLLVEGSEIFSKELPNVANKVSGIIKSLYDTCMPSWKFVGKEVRDLWFNEFKKIYQWDPSIEGAVQRGFNAIASRRLTDTLADARKIRRDTGRKPNWMTESVWDELEQQWASSETFKRQSEAGKKNRMSDPDGLGISKHFGGSKSFSGHKRKLEEENNRPVALDEVYLNTHLKGGKFCSEKAKKVYDKFTELMEQQRPSDGEDGDEGSESSTCQELQVEMWRKATGGPKDGIQKQAAALGLIGGASTSQPTSGPNVEVMTLMAQLMVSQLIAQTQQSTSPPPHQGASPLTFQMQIPVEYLSVLSSHLSASVPPPPPPPPPPSHAATDVESPANEFLDDLD